ncbi:chaperonin 10-like protein [Baffinella frigidus]|nr:chaperonin 10-like protein [Cryptophyta sp. CCMP2293]
MGPRNERWAASANVASPKKTRSTHLTIRSTRLHTLSLLLLVAAFASAVDSKMMKAVRVSAFGAPSELKTESIQRPEVGPGEVLVRVVAAGVNPVETYKRAGTYAKHLLPALPFTPGSDGAGVVELVGAGVTGVSAGQRVWLSGSTSGTYAEYCVAKEGDVHPLPPAVSFRAGAGIGTAYRTAYRALFTRVTAKAGHTVLVHGASGGVGLAAVQLARAAGCKVVGTLTTQHAVGLAAVQLARAAGCKVIGTAGSEEGMALVKAQGGEAVNHRTEGYIEEIRKLTPDGKGVDFVLEMAAHVNLNSDLGLLAKGGTVVVVGDPGFGDLGLLAKGGTVVVVGNRGEVNINPRLLMACEVSIVGVLGPGSPDEAKQVMAGIRGGLESGSLLPIAGPCFPLDDAPESHIEVIEHKLGSRGKIILDVSPEAKQEL